jgi:Tol biopolymer transport system component
LTREDGEGTDLWILDLTRGTRSRFTFDMGLNCCPVWSPDGKRIYFSSIGDDGWLVRARDAGGVRRAETLFDSGPPYILSDITPDGQSLVAYVNRGSSGFDVVERGSTGEGEDRLLVEGPGFTGEGRLSPDGRFLAYTSSEAGDDEVFLASYPDLEGRWQVSVAGGYEPRFRGDGREIFFLDLEDHLLSVSLDTSDGVQLGVPRRLFRASFASSRMRNRYEVTPDGEQFLFVSFRNDVRIPPLTVVLNWAADLQNR